MPFSLVFFFWDLYDLNVCSLNIVPEVSEIFLISFYSVFFILLCYSYSHHSFSSLIHSPASVILLLVPSSVCLISVIVLFIADCLFFNTSRSLLNIACVFSIHQFSSVAQSFPLFMTPFTAACQASLCITNSWSLLKLMSIELVMPSNHLIFCRPLITYS